MNTKNFITTLLTSSMVLASALVFGQQQAATPAQKAGFESQWMQNNLGTTDIQGKKIYNIVLHFAQMDEATGSDKKADSRTKDADIRAILTADQYRKYHQHLQDMQTQETQAIQQPAMQNNK